MFRASPQLMRAALAIIRVVVGIVFVYHGWQKVFQMGHANVTGFFTQAHIPLAPLSAFIVMYLELLGGAALIVGLLARILGALFAFEMLVAIALVHFPNGFSMQNNGYEFQLMLFAASLAFAIGSGGAAAVDDIIAARPARAS